MAAATLMRRERLEVVRPAAQAQVEIRSLTDYDALLGIQVGTEGGLA